MIDPRFTDPFQILDQSRKCLKCTNAPERRVHHVRRLILSLSRHWKIIPYSFNLSGIKLLENNNVSGGGYEDIFKGSFQGQVVALKRLRTFSSTPTTEKEKSVSMSSSFLGDIAHLLREFLDIS